MKRWKTKTRTRSWEPCCSWISIYGYGTFRRSLSVGYPSEWMHFNVTTLCQPHSVVLWNRLKVSNKYELPKTFTWDTTQQQQSLADVVWAWWSHLSSTDATIVLELYDGKITVAFLSSVISSRIHSIKPSGHCIDFGVSSSILATCTTVLQQREWAEALVMVRGTVACISTLHLIKDAIGVVRDPF